MIQQTIVFSCDQFYRVERIRTPLFNPRKIVYRGKVWKQCPQNSWSMFEGGYIYRPVDDEEAFDVLIQSLTEGDTCFV